MAWYLGQSWLIILLSVLLGLLIGWALWRRPWHKRYFSESEAITKLSRENSQALAAADRRRADADRTIAARDAEIERLTALVEKRAATAVTAARAASGAAAAEGSDESAADTAEMRVPVPTADAVDVDAVQASDVDVNDPATGEVDLSAIQAASVDVSAEATATRLDGDAAEPDGDTATPADQQISGLAGGALAEDGDEAAAAEISLQDESGEDELERVEGVGPRIAGALAAAGITTFRKLAESDVAELQSALEQAGLRFAPSLPTWSRQARLLAEGDEAGFLKLTEQLVAGRDVGRRS